MTALTRGEVCVVPASVFRQIVFASEAIADRLMRLLAKRVRELNTRLMEHALLDLRHGSTRSCCASRCPAPGPAASAW